MHPGAAVSSRLACTPTAGTQIHHNCVDSRIPLLTQVWFSSISIVEKPDLDGHVTRWEGQGTLVEVRPVGAGGDGGGRHDAQFCGVVAARAPRRPRLHAAKVVQGRAAVRARLPRRHLLPPLWTPERRRVRLAPLRGLCMWIILSMRVGEAWRGAGRRMRMERRCGAGLRRSSGLRRHPCHWDGASGCTSFPVLH